MTIAHARSHPRSIARKQRAVEMLRQLTAQGGSGSIRRGDNRSVHPSWKWSQTQGYVDTGDGKWWITPHGRYTLECWNK